MALPILTSAVIAAVFLSSWLAVRGLMRLDGLVEFPNRIGLMVSSGVGGLAGALCCILLLRSDTGFSLQLVLCIPYMTLLITAAWVDLTTRWAPLELMLPISCLTPVLAMSCPAGSVAGPLLWAVAGTMLYLVARLTWHAQTYFNCPHLPPADLLAIFLPMILFGIGHVAGLYYLLLIVALLAVRWAGLGVRGEMVAAGSNRVSIPLLAFTCPLVALFMAMLAGPWPSLAP